MQGVRIKSATLVEAGLAAMASAGKVLTRLPSKGRAMIYALPNGETVRVRTCNDHVLIVVGDDPTPNARLNIEGTDWLLLVMPEHERTPGKVITYLIPTAEAEAEARRNHEAWLASNPNTKGENRTWTLWFRDEGVTGNNYAVTWAKYRFESSTDTTAEAISEAIAKPNDIKTEVEKARRRIAEVAGVPIEAVKITINFEG